MTPLQKLRQRLLPENKPVKRLEIDPDTQALIDSLIEVGWGWAKYARKIHNQGWVSLRQKDCLIRMRQKLNTQRAKGLASSNPYYHLDRDEYCDRGMEGHPGEYDGC